MSSSTPPSPSPTPLGGDCLGTGAPLGFRQSFAFSVQTISTIGYGALAPTTLYADLLVTLESLTGLLSVGIWSGLCFAKFSRPHAKIAFSSCAVVSRYDGRPCLMMRMANERSSHIVDARVQVYALMDRTTLEGQHMRRFYPLVLERARTPLFSMSWLVMHFIEEDSVLAAYREGHPVEDLVTLVVTVTGVEDTLMQSVHSQTYYTPEQILLGHRFVDMVTHHHGTLALDYSKLNTVIEEHTGARALPPG